MKYCGTLLVVIGGGHMEIAAKMPTKLLLTTCRNDQSTVPSRELKLSCKSIRYNTSEEIKMHC